jgi:hypothetical protein
MADSFEMEGGTPPVTMFFNTREAVAPSEAETAEIAVTPDPEAVATPPSLDTPLTGDAEELRKQLLADYTRKTQHAADLARQAEAQQRELSQRQAAFEAERQALEPLRQFDNMLGQDPNLAAQVAPYVQGYKPGQSQPYSDRVAEGLARNETALMNGFSSMAEASLMQKYPDYAQRRDEIVATMRDLGMQYPGHDVVRITKQLEGAYNLVTGGKKVLEAKAEGAKEAVRNVAATRVSPGTSVAGPAPPVEPPMRRADGRLVSYDDITELAKEQLRRR